MIYGIKKIIIKFYDFVLKTKKKLCNYISLSYLTNIYEDEFNQMFVFIVENIIFTSKIERNHFVFPIVTMFGTSG